MKIIYSDAHKGHGGALEMRGEAFVPMAECPERMEVILAALSEAGLRDVEAFIALQKGIELYEAAHGADDQIGMLGEANRYFEIVQQRVPGYSAAYLLHSDKYIHMLMDEATGGQLEDDISAEDVAGAMEQAERDTIMGVEKAAKTGAVLWDKASGALDKTIDELNAQPDGKSP